AIYFVGFCPVLSSNPRTADETLSWKTDGSVSAAVFPRASNLFDSFVLAGGVTVKTLIYLSPVFPGKHFTTARFRSTARSEPVRLRGLTKPTPGTLQEGGAPFETTHWTVVLQASKSASDEAVR